MGIAIKLNVKINSPNVSAIKQKIISETAEKIHNQEGNTMQLTNDTDKMLCLIYDEFLNRKKGGIPKREAICFSRPSVLQTEFLQGIHEDDIYDSLIELANSGLIKLYYDCGFLLNDSAIIYMENRFSNKMDSFFDTVAKIKSLLP